MKNELHFDEVTDHSATDFAAQLAKAWPDGIDVYFESVGGKIWDAVLPLLNTYARVPVCGAISQYEKPPGAHENTDRLSNMMAQVMGKSLTLRGFIQTEYVEDQLADFLEEAGQWIADGKLNYREQVTHGFHTAPQALIDQLKGRNFGKKIVQVGEA